MPQENGDGFMSAFDVTPERVYRLVLLVLGSIAVGFGVYWLITQPGRFGIYSYAYRDLLGFGSLAIVTVLLQVAGLNQYRWGSAVLGFGLCFQGIFLLFGDLEIVDESGVPRALGLCLLPLGGWCLAVARQGLGETHAA